MPAEEEIDFVGEHKKKVTIVSDHSDNEMTDIGFLRKIIAAAKFDLDKDAALILMKNTQKFHFVTYQQKNQPNYCLSFGLSPQQLGLNFNAQLYQPFTYVGCTFLFAHSLKELQENINYKGALWKCLQHLFLKAG